MKCKSCGHDINIRVNRGQGLSPGHFFIVFVLLASLTVLFALLDYQALAWVSVIFTVVMLMVNIISYQEIIDNKVESDNKEDGVIVCEHCGAKNKFYPWSV